MDAKALKFLKDVIKEEKIKASFRHTQAFNAIFVKGRKDVTRVQNILHVLNYKILFTQPLKDNHFEILFLE